MAPPPPVNCKFPPALKIGLNWLNFLWRSRPGRTSNSRWGDGARMDSFLDSGVDFCHRPGQGRAPMAQIGRGNGDGPND